MKTSGATAREQGPEEDGRSLDSVLAEVQDALRGLRFGQVTIVVQDGVVVQIDRLERRRMRRRDSNSPETT